LKLKQKILCQYHLAHPQPRDIYLNTKSLVLLVEYFSPEEPSELGFEGFPEDGFLVPAINQRFKEIMDKKNEDRATQRYEPLLTTTKEMMVCDVFSETFSGSRVGDMKLINVVFTERLRFKLNSLSSDLLNKPLKINTADINWIKKVCRSLSVV